MRRRRAWEPSPGEARGPRDVLPAQRQREAPGCCVCERGVEGPPAGWGAGLGCMGGGWTWGRHWPRAGPHSFKATWGVNPRGRWGGVREKQEGLWPERGEAGLGEDQGGSGVLILMGVRCSSCLGRVL